MTSYRKSAVAVLTAAAVLTLGLGASPASAKSSDGFVRGYDGFADDFDDEGTLSLSLNEKSNATCMWQALLWSEGIRNDRDGIDGLFGNDTDQASRVFQDWNGLTVDGVVGKGTFAEAGKRLTYVSGSTARGKELTLKYESGVRNISLIRDSQGRYKFRDANSGWRVAGYDYLTCP
ncbi:peptidoglycan-binding protein [Streptomyces phaeochromogenes]|uniref:peptidoglycan-binding domain-containing protein n=1 Tax=Streptomyces phaeochromogenes TaxID=1923 RepID=UPI002DD9DDA6|nr:peptidoglycan-binding domain-containing protein [Streptomyces phaeochromogenes]WRZ26326.1 peptidoglycan-binding protein [Streptomyces phaeochromogenes]WSJ11312.1 peptidoglycan-binding protein [Streptomyces phaeochromogenes]